LVEAKEREGRVVDASHGFVEVCWLGIIGGEAIGPLSVF
jgi:hypothetical protein